jgi:signal transduction histidine kinase
MFVWLFVALATSPLPFLDRDPGDYPLSPFTAYSLISIVTNLLYFGGAYYFGDRAWASARAGVELQARSEELAVERERNAAQAVVRERLRIARDLHDVVAHHVSLMGVQAGAARRMVDSDPDRAADSLVAIEESARQAVEELHRMLGTLREVGEDGVGGRSPLDLDGPSTLRLSSIPALVEHAESAGLGATFNIVGTPREVPATVESTLFRVAQEAVTNTLKHASSTARLDVRLRYLDDAVELESTDSGGASQAAVDGAGLGLIGMRERIAAVGGTLETGPRARGGFLVRARISTMPTPNASATSSPAADPGSRRARGGHAVESEDAS